MSVSAPVLPSLLQTSGPLPPLTRQCQFLSFLSPLPPISPSPGTWNLDFLLPSTSEIFFIGSYFFRCSLPWYPQQDLSSSSHHYEIPFISGDHWQFKLQVQTSQWFSTDCSFSFSWVSTFSSKVIILTVKTKNLLASEEEESAESSVSKSLLILILSRVKGNLDYTPAILIIRLLQNLFLTWFPILKYPIIQECINLLDAFSIEGR